MPFGAVLRSIKWDSGEGGKNKVDHCSQKCGLLTHLLLLIQDKKGVEAESQQFDSKLIFVEPTAGILSNELVWSKLHTSYT